MCLKSGFIGIPCLIVVFSVKFHFLLTFWSDHWQILWLHCVTLGPALVLSGWITLGAGKVYQVNSEIECWPKKQTRRSAVHSAVHRHRQWSHSAPASMRFVHFLDQNQESQKFSDSFPQRKAAAPPVVRIVSLARIKAEQHALCVLIIRFGRNHFD